MSRCDHAKQAALYGAGLPSLDHVRSCPECNRERSTVRALVELAQDLPYEAPAPARLEEIRSALLVMGPVPARPWWRRGVVWAAAALVLVGGASAYLGRQKPLDAPAVVDWPTLPATHALVRNPTAVRYAQEPAHQGQPERLRLDEGPADLDLGALSAGERLIVWTDDAALEATGNRLWVEAKGRQLVAIKAINATVILRLADRREFRLGPGESWSRPEQAPPAVLDAKPARAPRTHPEKKAAAESPPSERAFRDAWAAFARGDMREAAALFEACEAAAPTGSLVEDASYGRALALERGGHDREAITAMRAFLDRFPSSPRADEVRGALGWSLLDTRDFDEAEQLFRQLEHSPVDRVQDSARRGLEELSRRRR
ncbi:MAG: tetratricopeptide repeat protein [Myxococcota bacterium]